MDKDFEKMKEIFGSDVFGKITASSTNDPCIILPIITFLVSKKIPFTLSFTPETPNNLGKIVLTITVSPKFSFSITWTFC